VIRPRWVSGVWRRGFFDARALEQALTGLAVLVFLGAVLFIAGLLLGCRPVDDPGAQQRAAVLTLANGVYVADQACASVARGKTDAREGYELARACAFAYDAARVSLIAADEKLDREGEDVACEIEQAIDYARQMAGLIEKHGGKLPKALVQAFEFAKLATLGCAG
jgi:hypothetical protein